MKTNPLVLQALIGSILVASLGFSHAALAQFAPRVTAVLWDDANQDGIRQASEQGRAGVTVSLVYVGPDDQPYTGDDEVIEVTTSNTGEAGLPRGDVRFTLGAPGETYYMAIFTPDKPAGTSPAPFQQGSDRSVDNDLTLPIAGQPLWATATFQMLARGQTHAGTDMGLTTVTFDPGYTLHLPALRS
jgi:hypothetical protein